MNRSRSGLPGGRGDQAYKVLFLVRRFWRRFLRPAFCAGFAGLALLSFELSIGPSPVAAQDWQGSPVAEVHIQPEDGSASAADLASLLQSLPQKAGQPYDAASIEQSIAILYRTGRFSDIRVDAKRQGSAVVLTFLTQAGYFVGQVTVSGAPAPPSESQLRAATGLQLGRPFNEDEIPGVIDSLRRLLEGNSYFQASIEPRYQRHPETQQIDVSFEIQSGKRARLGNLFLTGTSVFTAERLLREGQWKRGKTLSASDIENGLARIRRLYRNQDYLESDIRLERRQFRKEAIEVDLTLSVTAGAKTSLSLTGAKMSHSRFVKLVPAFAEGSLDEDLLREGARNLQNYFQSQGYFQAQTSYERKSAGSSLSVEYHADLGPRQRLLRVDITGNRYFTTETLRERMTIAPRTFASRRGRFSQALLAQDLDAIRSLYQANGFRQVQAAATRAEKQENSIVVTIKIDEGPQTLIGDFSITGNSSFSREQLAGLINAESGQPYSDTTVASDRSILLTYYFNAGFRDTAIRTNASPGALGRMDLEYVITEGSREYVHGIFLQGLKNYRRDIVDRQIQLQAGQPLSQSALLDSQRRLYSLGVFTQVDMAVQDPSGEERYRNLLIYLEEARRYTATLGLGFVVGRFGTSGTSASSVQGTTQFSPNVALGVTRLGLLGRPDTLALRTQYSTLEKRASLSLTAPRLLHRDSLNATATADGEITRDVQTFTAHRLEGSIQIQDKYSRATTFIHRFTYRRVTIEQGTLKISPEEIPLESRPDLVGMLEETWVRDTRDNPGNAQRGMFSTADVGLSTRAFGSQTDFVRLLAQNSSYYKLEKWLVLARSTQIGIEAPFMNSGEIPLAERFFSGGGTSNRGFALNQAGPRDPVTGDPIGGDALLMNNVELRFPLWGQTIGGAIFEDAGNVFARVRDLDIRMSQPGPGDLNYISNAVGFGVRYQTPLGAVRLDLGYNLTPPRFPVQNGDTTTTQTLKRYQFVFSVGQTF